MALQIGPCVRCGLVSLQMQLKSDEGWVCRSHLPTPPVCKHGRELCDDCAVDDAVEEARQGFKPLLEVYGAAKFQQKHDASSISFALQDAMEAYENMKECVNDWHRGTECKCCHAVAHCCTHHCCCFNKKKQS